MVTLRPRGQGSKNNKQGSAVSETMETPRSRLPVPPKKQDSKKRLPSANESGLPVGVRFSPTDHELVDYYLRSRIALGNKFHSDFVSECPDFYGQDEPWVVWEMYGGGSESKKAEDDKTLYFFTRRRRLSPTSVRFDRKVGSGTWSGQYPKEVFDDEDESVVIGIKREFRYEGGCDENHNKAWLMQEYQIVDDDSDIVLCALRKNPRQAPPVQKKRKTNVDQPRAKRHKKEQSCGQEEEDGGSVDDQSVEPQGATVEQPKMELMIPFELDHDHPMLQPVLSYDQFHHVQDCYYPELLVEDKPDFSIIDELLAQPPTCCDDQVVQFEEESSEFMALLLKA